MTVNRSVSPLASDVVVRNSGSIYEIRMGDLWEKYFSDMTFGMFKAKFFKGELFAQDGTNRISVRGKTQIHYGQDFDTTRAKLRQYMEAVAQVFDGYRKEHKMFTAEEFRQKAQEALGAEVLNADFAKALLELFVMDVQADPTRREGDRMKFIQATQRGGNRIGLLYRVTNGNYFSMANWMDQKLVNCAPNREETEYMGYIPAPIGGKQNPVMRLLAVLEIFGLASYEVRGCQNLENAIKNFDVSVEGKVCTDVGSSTGGFTDCMLQNGAVKVFAIDVGRGQLDWKLRQDPRVVCMEKTNIRYVTPEDIGEPVQFSSIDVSFISLTKVLLPIRNYLTEDGQIVALIKPQFEAGREKVGKKGVVREKSTHIEVIHKVIDYAMSIGVEVLNLEFSPIKGPEGNIEYLVHLQKCEATDRISPEIDVEKTVDQSFATLAKG